MTKVFLDTDVILDFLLKRRPFDEDAARIFAESEYGRLQLHTSTISFLNTYYVCGRIVGEHNALELVRELRKLIVLLSVTSSMVDSALTSCKRPHYFITASRSVFRGVNGNRVCFAALA